MPARISTCHRSADAVLPGPTASKHLNTMNNDLINIKMETTINKSLSARIKRRNAQGFLGFGHHIVGQRYSPVGDYRDPKQNHKELSRDASVQDAINYLKPDERDKADGKTMFSHWKQVAPNHPCQL